MRLTQFYARDRNAFHEKAQLQNVMQKIQLAHIDRKKHSQQSQTERSYSAIRNLNYMKHVNKTSEKKYIKVGNISLPPSTLIKDSSATNLMLQPFVC